MQLLSDNEALKWCEDLGFHVDRTRASTVIDFLGSSANRLRVPIVEDATAVVGLAYIISMTGVPAYEEREFGGALVWLQRWEIWSESIDRAGYILLDGIRATSGRTAEIGTAPAQLFAEGEFAKAHACLSLPMLFQWDAHFVPAHGGFVAFVSHEGHVDFIARDQHVHGALLERFNSWSPTEAVASPRSAG